LSDVDAIFAYNDYMALGAYLAVSKLGFSPKIFSIDGFAGENGGLDLIRNGVIDLTVTAPTGGREAIKYAMDILKKENGVPKQIILRSHNITSENVDDYEMMLNKTPEPYTSAITMGFSQVGAESAWRLANTASIKEAAREFGINLVFREANQSLEQQKEAIREFISLGVDVIVISPVIEEGWDDVLWEAKAANIPVLLSDRKIHTQTKEALFLTYFGVDAIEEGRRAMRWILQNVEAPAKILELEGTISASPTVDRGIGFHELLDQNPGYEVVYSESGDFTKEGGKAVIAEYLRNHEWDIDVIFSHNDDMALGAIPVLQANGIEPGKDVRIVSVDGAKEAFDALVDGKLNCVVECSPLLGPQLMKGVKDLMAGKELPLRIITEERVYTQENAAAEIGNRKY
jgi:simple sugar transport system substrate-binding protein